MTFLHGPTVAKIGPMFKSKTLTNLLQKVTRWLQRTNQTSFRTKVDHSVQVRTLAVRKRTKQFTLLVYETGSSIFRFIAGPLSLPDIPRISKR